MCSFPECKSPDLCQSMCAGHYAQVRRRKPLTALREYRHQSGVCDIAWCARPAEGKGFCKSHVWIRNRYTLEVSQMRSMLDPGVCDACGTETTDLHIDHDHACCPGKASCGKCVRGVMCGLCNRALGMLGDDPAKIERLREYCLRTAGARLSS